MYLFVLLHLLKLLRVPALLDFPLIPIAISNVTHDFHALLDLGLFLIDSLLVVFLDLGLETLLLSLDQTLLQLFLERTLALLLVMLFLKVLMFLLSKFFLLLQGLSDKLVLFPLAHAMSSLLILLAKHRESLVMFLSLTRYFLG